MLLENFAYAQAAAVCDAGRKRVGEHVAVHLIAATAWAAGHELVDAVADQLTDENGFKLLRRLRGLFLRWQARRRARI